MVWIGYRRRSPAALAAAASFALAMLAALVGPFAFASPENFRFGLWGYHAVRSPPEHGGDALYVFERRPAR